MDLNEYRDKVRGCWTGKNIGGTLGMPFEGRRETFSVSFYQQPPGHPAPNDDLDLQLVWLKALEERGFNINPMVLAEYWLDYVVVDWNEYGVARDNIKLGIPPPFSGKFRNGWQNSNGGWIRSEIWASLFPGRPDLAAKYGLMDACVDHGDGEGTYAEAFTASLESAAFFESDPKKLLQLALSYVPEKSEIRGAVNAAISCYEKGLTWKEAREAVVKATSRTGWFNAPNNLGFVAIGLLYGEGDFGKAICTAVNCGDDTDCTGATVGATMGIIIGEKNIPENWKSYIGDEIKTVATGNFKPPSTITELTNRTVALGSLAASVFGFGDPVNGFIDNQKSGSGQPFPLEALYDAGPFVVSVGLPGGLSVSPGEAARVALEFENKSPNELRLSINESSYDANPIGLGPFSRLEVKQTIKVKKTGFQKICIPISSPGRISSLLPCFTLFGSDLSSEMTYRASENYAVEYKDAKAVDEDGKSAGGVIHAIVTDDPTRTWHSSKGPMPHSITITFSEPKPISETMINFAPRDRPVAFEGHALSQGKWVKLFEERNYAHPFGYRTRFKEIMCDAFKLVINQSTGGNSVELSQIELY
ncbi:MAG: ADP-ribosylglycohydrolase family protein [Thermoprotei archaeon]